jgi:hypothetical protein
VLPRLKKSACYGKVCNKYDRVQERDERMPYVEFPYAAPSLDLSLCITSVLNSRWIENVKISQSVTIAKPVYQCLQLKTAKEIYIHEESANYS